MYFSAFVQRASCTPKQTTPQPAMHVDDLQTPTSYGTLRLFVTVIGMQPST